MLQAHKDILSAAPPLNDQPPPLYGEIMSVLNLGIHNGRLAKSSTQEAILFKYYRQFQNLKKNNFDRYTHTLLFLENYLALLNNNYATFTKRMDFTAEDFRYLQNFAKACHEYDWLRTVSCIIAHDYGTENVNDIARHMPISAEKCVKDFTERLHYTQEQLDCAKLLIANHSYFGDLLLGEAPFGYYPVLKQKILAAGAPDDLKILILLNMLDTHSVNARSYLNAAKLNSYKQIINETIFAPTKDALLQLRLSWIAKQLDPAQIDETFHDVYLQYFKDIFQTSDDSTNRFLLEKNARGRPLGESFLNQLCRLWTLTHYDANYTYITFQTAEMSDSQKQQGGIYSKHCAMAEASKKYLTADGGIAEGCVLLDNKTFLDFRYEIQGPYLVIFNNLP